MSVNCPVSLRNKPTKDQISVITYMLGTLQFHEKYNALTTTKDIINELWRKQTYVMVRGYNPKTRRRNHEGGKEDEVNCKDIIADHLIVENEEFDFDRVRNLCSIETIGINPDNEVPMSDKEILKSLEQNKVHTNKRYETRLLWKEDSRELKSVPLKILGIIWDNVNDNLNFDIRQFEKLKHFMKADICHSYQILKNHGIPDERTILLMTDDIANNGENLTTGIVINHPNGNDVYKGIPKDYTGEDVTPKNFMAILKGDEKTLAGVGSGLIAFPEDELSATDLNRTINYMYENNMYGKMVIYIEAYESGLMFENILPNIINVNATTAANSEESSYGYFDGKRDTYLGDLYSVHWMKDSDQEVLTTETLQNQFKVVKKKTTESHVQEFGDTSIAQLHVSEFQERIYSKPDFVPKVEKDSVFSRDVHIEIVKRKLIRSNSGEKQSVLTKN
ncbi:legumain [Trichonephila clavipes]|nr:legumain [Trichonephila clavipes]